MKKPQASATLQTVADRAGVHYSLVSRVLRNDPTARISSEKRALVIAVANEVGYRPNRVAQSLRVRRSHILAMVVPDITNPFHAVMFRGVEAVAQAYGYNVILCDTDDNETRFRSLIDVLSQGHVDGLLIASAKQDDQTIDWLHGQPLPFVLLNRRRAQDRDPWIGPDDHQLGRLGAEHLAGQGHRNILLLVGDLQINNMHRRRQGFFETLAAFGIGEQEVVVRSNLLSHESARAAVAELEPDIRAGRITAIFALSSIASSGAVAALAKAGLRWPQDVSILGYSVARSPDITCVRPPAAEIGTQGMHYLMQQLKSRSANPADFRVMLPAELVHADSTRRL